MFWLKGFLGLFAVGFIGFCFVILRFGLQSNYVLAVPQLLIFCILAAPLLILLSQRWGTLVKNENATLFFLLFFSVSLRLIVPLTDGTSAFVTSFDPVFNFQLTSIYSETGHWVFGQETGPALPMLFTPVLHLFSASTSKIIGIDLYNISRFMPPIVFTLITMLLLYCTFRRLIGSQKALLACFIFAISYKFNSFTSLYIPESLGIVFFAMALYGLISMRSERGPMGRKYAAVFILGSSLLVTTHFFSSFMFLLAISLGLVVSKLFKSSNVGKSSITAVNFVFFATFMYAWMLFIAYHFFYLQVGYIGDYFNEFLAMITRPWEPRSVAGVQEAGLPLWESIIAYGGILIPVLFGLLTCFNLFIRHRRTANHYTYWRRMFAAASFVLTAVTTIGLFAIVGNPDVAYRFIPFTYIFLAPTAAMSLGGIRGPEQHTRMNTTNSFRPPGSSGTQGVFGRARVLLFITFLIVPVISAGIMFPPFVGEPIMLDDGEIVVVSKWFSTYVNKSSAIVGEVTLGTPITAGARLDFWKHAESNQFNFTTIWDAVYYEGNVSSILNFFESGIWWNPPETLLILNRHFIDHQHFLLHSFTRRRVLSIDAMDSAFKALDRYPSLNKIYEGEAPSIYIASTGN